YRIPGRAHARGRERTLPESLEIAFTVNRRPTRVAVRSDQRLLDVLRDQLRLTGAKEGCGKGECGACTVILDGQAVDYCLMMAYQADGAVLETIEWLADGSRLHALQQAFIDEGGVQCGICIPGMILAAKAFLDRTPHADAGAIREGLAGNLCRCTGYTKIFAAVAAAARSDGERPAPPSAANGAAPGSRRPPSLAAAPELLAPGPG